MCVSNNMNLLMVPRWPMECLASHISNTDVINHTAKDMVTIVLVPMLGSDAGPIFRCDDIFLTERTRRTQNCLLIRAALRSL